VTRCFYHPELETTTRCDLCGKPICARCAHSVEGHTVCERCEARAAKGGYDSAKERLAQVPAPTWIGLVLPGLAQMLKGEIYKGSLMLLYFLLAAYSHMGALLALSWGISIWDYFWPLINEESRGHLFLNFRQFAGIILIFVGALLLAFNFANTFVRFSPETARIVASGATIAFGLFVVLNNLAEHKEEVKHDS
jgi:TM2 domain-containing membrane protein YozV